MAALPATISDAASWATADDLKLIDLLLEEDQSHLFAGFRLGQDIPQKQAFLAQVQALQTGYPGGLKAYLSNARGLLRASADGDNPFVGMTPEVPEGRVLDYASASFIEAEEVGLALFKDCAFVLVAGGLGERLGYAGIKLSLPVSHFLWGAAHLFFMHALFCFAGSNHNGQLLPRSVCQPDPRDAGCLERLARHIIHSPARYHDLR
jgi:UDP-sugar pyrophosphorylase